MYFMRPYCMPNTVLSLGDIKITKKKKKKKKEEEEEEEERM